MCAYASLYCVQVRDLVGLTDSDVSGSLQVEVGIYHGGVCIALVETEPVRAIADGPMQWSELLRFPVTTADLPQVGSSLEGGQTHTDTHRHTQTHTDTQTHRHRHTQTHTDTQTDTHTYTETHAN
jgi:hypothetical protein